MYFTLPPVSEDHGQPAPSVLEAVGPAIKRFAARLPWRPILLFATLALLAAFTLLPESAAERIEHRLRPVDPLLTWIKPQPVDPEIVKLIDQLTEVSQQGVGTHTTAYWSNFLATDEEPKFGGPVLGSTPPVPSPVMRELVRRGLFALPDLLNHLSDPRKTKLKVSPLAGGMWLGDFYHPRHGEMLPLGRTRDYDGPWEQEHYELLGGVYRLRVGDLCYVAIGQIVNRHLNALEYIPSGNLQVNSPVFVPALADAVRKDWANLTPEEHKRSLIHDVSSVENTYWAASALIRLCFYYPYDGITLTTKALGQPGKVKDHAIIVEALSALPSDLLHGVIVHAALQDLRAPLEEQAHARLINALKLYRSGAVDEAVRHLFLAADLEKDLKDDRLAIDAFVLACLDRIQCQGVDHRLEGFLTRRILEMGSPAADSREAIHLQALQNGLFELQVKRAAK